MKKILCILLIFVSFDANVLADGFIVKSFIKDERDLTARTKPRKDKNGIDCAFIKIQISENDLKFEGEIIGDVINNISSYNLYMSECSEYLIINGHNVEEFIVYFSDLSINHLESKCTYIMELEIDKYSHHTKYTNVVDGNVSGHGYIDIGLSVYWAATNIGADSPNNVGDKFAWGETNPKKIFTWNTYKYRDSNGEEGEYCKYIGEYQDYELFCILDKDDDAANYLWGDKWRMPSVNDFIELYNYCTFYWTQYNNTYGYVVTGPNGHSVFFPFKKCGTTKIENPYHPEVDNLFEEQDCCSYWSNSQMYFQSNTIQFLISKASYEISSGLREEGAFIKPVLPK